MLIDYTDFPNYARDLGIKERKILKNLVGERVLKKFTIKVDDNIYYTKYNYDFNEFDGLNGFEELKKYMLSWYFIEENKPIEYLKLIKSSKLDPSINGDWSIFLAASNDHPELLKFILNNYKIIDPSANHNCSISVAEKKGSKEIVYLLLGDDRVKSKLTEEEINRFKSKISRIESIKRKVKMKIIDSFNHLWSFILGSWLYGDFDN